MKQNINIEDLFRDKLSSLEADPGAGMWEAIQSKAATANTASVSAAAKTGISSFKAIVVISTFSVLSGLGIGYMLWNEKAEPTPAGLSIAKQNENTAEKSIEPVNADPSIQNTGSTSVVIIEESEPANGKNTQRTKVVLKEEVGPTSIAQGWMTPSDKKEILMNAKASLAEKTEKTTVVTHGAQSVKQEEKQNPRVELIEVPVQESAPVVVISASVSGGPAPLYVEFSNTYEAESYEWNFGDGQSSRESAPTHKFEEAGTYAVTLTVRDAKGNKASDRYVIQVREGSSLVNPNVFTPDGDGINDYFRFETKNIDAVFVQVFGRNGHVYFESSDVDFRWDGRDQQGKLLPAGVYFYQYKALDSSGKEYKGTSQLTIRY